ncbi:MULTISPECIES: ATP-binding protein [Eubacterium]|uniref:Ethanolamine utilization cobalamin adenosyltransferase n=1 Tax=Eubacterium barkeri TaxID=1528 RepID=A0A1H3I139_EUBBA|nr:ATP-binding protein [Eubacterium barkeri]SDY20829.1 ethanolamine utilization cobalamin adenosyltransferase [Eubacterium barkeri]
MKVITEAALRQELKANETVYHLEQGKILSPAAQEYLSQRKIKVLRECQAVSEKGRSAAPPAALPPSEKPRYIDGETGAFFMEKPEYMTQLHGNVLVMKTHPRIIFRGKLDYLQGVIIRNQAGLMASGRWGILIEELEDILETLRQMMRSEVLDTPFVKATIIGLDQGQLRAQSHDPMAYFNIKQMVMPDKSLGEEYACLNMIRTEIRQVEISAIMAYQQGRTVHHGDIVEGLNRLSSAVHIMMCKYLAGMYNG